MQSEKQKKKILFVDDEENILRALKRQLLDHNHKWQMTFINDPVEANRIMHIEKFDAAVLDIKMAQLSGLELLEMIKADDAIKDIQVIILTGHGDDSLKRQALELGATDLLNKPINKEDLVARLSNVLQIKAYQDELQERNKDLRQQLIQSQKMELVGILSAGVVHDLKNILSIIGGYSQMISFQFSDNKEIKEPIDKVQDAADRAKNIMWQILRFSQPGDQTETIVNLSDIINESRFFFKSTLKSDIVLKWSRPKSNNYIKMSESQVHQLLMNLVINAGQAIEGKGVIEIELSVAEANEMESVKDKMDISGTYAKIVVSDTGPGMDNKTLDKIFDTHFSTKGSMGGSGLGLTVVKRIVEDNCGFIVVESTVGDGTKFIIFLPSTENGLSSSMVP